MEICIRLIRIQYGFQRIKNSVPSNITWNTERMRPKRLRHLDILVVKFSLNGSMRHFLIEKNVVFLRMLW